MKIKVYRGKTQKEALAKVKSDLGRDALILHTNSVRDRGLLGLLGKQVIEIAATPIPPRQPARVGPACDAPLEQRKNDLLEMIGRQSASEAYRLDLGAGRATREPVAAGAGAKTAGAPAPSAAAPYPVASPRDPAADEIRSEIKAIRTMVDRLVKRESRSGAHGGVGTALPERLKRFHADMVHSGFSAEASRRLVNAINDSLTGEQLRDDAAIEAALLHRLQRWVRVSGPIDTAHDGPRVVWMVGPTGVGKTTTIAKLAANHRLSLRQPVGLITNDTYRIAAIDQLQKYARIMSVPLEVVLSPQELHQAIDQFADCKLVLIDTAGRSHRDDLKMNQLRDFMAVCPCHEVHLVLSAAASRDQLLGIVDRFKDMGVNRIVFSKLDEADSFGHLIEVAEATGYPISYLTTGQDVPDDIETATSQRMIELVLKGAPAYG